MVARPKANFFPEKSISTRSAQNADAVTTRTRRARTGNYLVSDNLGGTNGGTGIGSTAREFLLTAHFISSGIGGTASRYWKISAASAASVKIDNTLAITTARFIHYCRIRHH
jgi:hypothetical protein